MSLSYELQKAIDDFDEFLNLFLGKENADEMRAYIRDKYRNVRTKKESDEEYQVMNLKYIQNNKD